MTKQSDAHNRTSRNRLAGALILLTIFGAILYFVPVPYDPPGFYIDESSIAYNAHLIAQTGHDEHGDPWPLYFRAFGDYKNPVYVYLLAAVFRIKGTSISAARHLSATLGLAERARILGATLTVHSEPERGTTVKLNQRIKDKNGEVGV